MPARRSADLIRAGSAQSVGGQDSRDKQLSGRCSEEGHPTAWFFGIRRMTVLKYIIALAKPRPGLSSYRCSAARSMSSSGFLAIPANTELPQYRLLVKVLPVG